MFLINTKPLRKTRTIAAYAQFLFNLYAQELYQSGVSEVHLVFDKPGQQNSTQNNLSTQKETKEASLNVHNMSISHFLHKLPHDQAGNSTFNADCVNGHLLKLLVLHTYRKEVQCFDVVKHYLQVAFLGKEKTMHGSSKLAKSLRQVQVINVMQIGGADSRFWRHATQAPYTRILIILPTPMLQHWFRSNTGNIQAVCHPIECTTCS